MAGTKPYTTTQVVASGGSTGTDTYAYDETGNMKTRTINGAVANLTWDKEGELATTGADGYLYVSVRELGLPVAGSGQSA